MKKTFKTKRGDIVVIRFIQSIDQYIEPSAGAVRKKPQLRFFARVASGHALEVDSVEAKQLHALIENGTEP